MRAGTSGAAVPPMNEEAIRALVANEFGAIAEHFSWHALSIDQAQRSTNPEVARPGVYVFLKSGKPNKVGRHLRNSRKRALEHIRDGTGGRMAALDTDPEAKLILINARSAVKQHWIVALEVFLEAQLSPAVRSKRIC